MGREVGSVGLSAGSKRTPAEGRRNRMRCDSGAPFLVLLGFNSRESFATARHSDSRYVGPPILPSRRFASCPTKARAVPLRHVVGSALQRLRREILQRKDWAQRRLCGGMPLAANPSWAVSFEAPLDGTHTFDWRLTVQARDIPRVVFYGLPCCLSWSHVALGMGPAK